MDGRELRGRERVLPDRAGEVLGTFGEFGWTGVIRAVATTIQIVTSSAICVSQKLTCRFDGGTNRSAISTTHAETRIAISGRTV